MTIANWVRWNRTELELAEREALLGALTPEQQRQLLHNDYVWVERGGVIWRSRAERAAPRPLHAQHGFRDDARRLSHRRRR